MRPISAREMAEWDAYERLVGPSDLRRLDPLFAQLAWTMVRMWGDEKAKSLTLEDMRLRLGDLDRPEGPDWDAMLSTVRQINADAGGVDLTDPDDDGGGL